MNELDFDDYASRAKEHFAALTSMPIYSMSDRPKGLNVAGIYVLYENGEPVYVGRSNKISARLSGHIAKSHNKASFAIKRTRQIHNLPATYKKEGSRKSIVEHPVFGLTFLQQIEDIKKMEFRLIKVQNHIEQYLTELLITMELALDTSGFDNS